MALVRLDVRFEHLDGLAPYANEHHVVVALVDADTIIALGSLHDHLSGPVGVWLELSANYAAPLAARDVKTLSWLVNLDTVVVSGPRAESGAQVLEALLTNDEVNFANEVATVVGAYNRPAPPAVVTVWSYDGVLLRHGDDVLRETSSASLDVGNTTTFR